MAIRVTATSGEVVWQSDSARLRVLAVSVEIVQRPIVPVRVLALSVEVLTENNPRKPRAFVCIIG